MPGYIPYIALCILHFIFDFRPARSPIERGRCIEVYTHSERYKTPGRAIKMAKRPIKVKSIELPHFEIETTNFQYTYIYCNSIYGVHFKFVLSVSR